MGNKELPFYKHELKAISTKLVYEIGDKLSQCIGETPLILTFEGDKIPINVKIDVPKFKELFE